MESLSEKVDGTMDSEMITKQTLTGERALFGIQDKIIWNCVFEDGESPIKESSNVEVYESAFRWKYPLWYCKDVTVAGTKWEENARAGVWYTDRISVSDCIIDAPKNFRRCSDIRLSNVHFTDAKETMWNCRGIELSDVTVAGDYFAMNCEDMRIDHFVLDGNYGFDGAKNVEIHDSKLLTKDAFWNSENVTVYDSYISGEYLGWNAKNLTLVNCTIESLQGMCYIENLRLIDCKLKNTTLAFEYSTVDARIDGAIDSVLNPSGGRILCDSIGELVLEKDKIDPSKTKIVCRKDGSDGQIAFYRMQTIDAISA